MRFAVVLAAAASVAPSLASAQQTWNPALTPDGAALQRIVRTAAQGPSASLAEVAADVNAVSPNTRGRLWEVTTAKFTPGDWIISTPQYADERRTRLAPSFGSLWPASFRTTALRARRYLDVTSLVPPEGPFLQALKDAIGALSRRNAPIIVRVLYGSIPGIPGVHPESLLQELLAGIVPGSRISVSVATLRSSNSPPSWNHTKMVAADGEYLVTGGHNVLEGDYLHGDDPVHDLSMRLSGAATKTAHRIANILWQDACEMRWRLTEATGSVVIRTRNSDGRTVDGECVPAFPEQGYGESPAAESPATTVQVMPVARLGGARRAIQGRNPSDTALLSMIRHARRTLHISQQSILSSFIRSKMATNVARELAAAARRGVRIHLLTSTSGSEGGGSLTGYRSQTSPAELFEVLVKNAGQDRAAIARGFFNLSTAMSSREVKNHSKLVIADGTLTYIGSHNLYDDNLAELGIIIESSRLADELTTRYFIPFWETSRRHALDKAARR